MFSAEGCCLIACFSVCQRTIGYVLDGVDLLDPPRLGLFISVETSNRARAMHVLDNKIIHII